MGRSSIVVVLAAVLALSSGCRRAISFTATSAETADGFLEITASTKENAYYSISVVGHPEDHFEYSNTIKLKLPLESIPKGPQTLTVMLKQGKRTGTFPLKVERQPLKPVLEIASPGATGRTVSCSGAFCKGTIAVDGPKANVKVTTMKGTKVRIGAAEFTASDRVSNQSLAIFRLEDVAMPAITKGSTLVQVPVHLESPEGVSQDGTLDLEHGTFVGEVRAALGKVVNGPITFGDEPPTPKQARSLFWIWETELFGSAQSIKDLDLVAVTKLPDVRKASCGTYTGNVTGTKVTIDRDLQDMEMVVYDRRSGKQVARKLFTAPFIACPDSTFSRDDLRSRPDAATIRKWLATLVK